MVKKVSIVELSDKLKGTIIGNFDERVRLVGTCSIDNYIENRVSFVRNRKYGEMLARLRNAVVLVPNNLADLCEKYPQNTYIVVDNVETSLMDVQEFFYSDSLIITREGISPTAKVDESAEIGNHVYIGEYVYIGENVVIGDRTKIMHNTCIFDNVSVGSRTLIYSSVCIYQGCQIGNDCIIDAGAAIGPDGFRYEQDIERKVVRKMLHVGRVVIGDRVEIGANTAIDRATFEGDATIIADDVKIDNLVHIAHNSSIGSRAIIVTQSCIGGSVRIGEDVWIGIGAAISNGVSIGNKAKVLINAVVAYDVLEDEVVSGFYAMPHRQWKQLWTKWKEQK